MSLLGRAGSALDTEAKCEAYHSWVATQPQSWWDYQTSDHLADFEVLTLPPGNLFAEAYASGCNVRDAGGSNGYEIKYWTNDDRPLAPTTSVPALQGLGWHMACRSPLCPSCTYTGGPQRLPGGEHLFCGRSECSEFLLYLFKPFWLFVFTI